MVRPAALLAAAATVLLVVTSASAFTSPLVKRTPLAVDAKRRHHHHHHHHHSTRRSRPVVAALDAGGFEAATSLVTAWDNADIATAFNIGNFGPQPFWVLMILLPNNIVTKKVHTIKRVPYT